MIEFSKLLNEYSSEAYFMYTRTIPEQNWGNKSDALEYLKKYHLAEEEYLNVSKFVQNIIFKNQKESLPKIMFNTGFSMMAIRGGILFEKEDFERLQNCILQLGDKKLFVIQNDFGGELNSSPLRMCYPSDISWEELMSGNFISTVIFEMFANEYFVFSESGSWGKYAANDYKHPLDIIGFKPEFEPLFKNSFVQPLKEQEVIKEWLPPEYQKIIK